jgi:hypothetical protein
VTPGTGAWKAARHMFRFSFNRPHVGIRCHITIRDSTVPYDGKALVNSPMGGPSSGAISRDRCDPEFPGEEQRNDDIIIQHKQHR